MIELIHGDCLRALETVRSDSVDLVLTDPPYNISRPNNFGSMGRAGIHFGQWDVGADLFSYLDGCFRVIRPGGALVVFNGWRNLGAISAHAEGVGFVVKDLLRLVKRNPMPRNRDRRYVTDYELALWFVVPGAKWTFNRQDASYQRPRFVHSIDKGLHPTQKSLGLMRELVRIHSNKGDVVLDPFMGSGTAGVAAVQLGRKFVGVEIDDVFFKTATGRIGADPAAAGLTVVGGLE